jgi:hypothetical protein
MVALVDALQFERPSKRGTPPPSLNGESGSPRVVMLSVGTGEPGPMPYNYKRLIDGGFLHWGRPINEIVSLSQSRLVHHQAGILLQERYFRINPILTFPIALDDASRFTELRNKTDLDVNIERFLQSQFL